MSQQLFDPSSKWMLEEQGASILYLAGARSVLSCRARKAEVVQPRQLPDGLLEVRFAGSAEPGAHAPLAFHFIRQKQPEKAIELAREYEKRAPVLLTARLLTGAVRAKRVDATTNAEITKWLDDALRAATGNRELEVGLIGTRAQLLDAQGQHKDAIKEYERAISS